jgi:signal recognition particle receptor subunit beta
MALINHAKREINAKIVYYGREGTGKRNSLQYIYDRIKPSLRGELKFPSSKGDSLFFFDFSPFENPVFGEYRIRFHVYTLPGKVANPAAWKMTLKGADGLVIVADGATVPAERENISVLRGFLAAYGVALNDLPCVLQLTRNGIPSELPIEEMAEVLDLPNIQVCPFEPASGVGVLEALSSLSRAVMARIGQDDAFHVSAHSALPESGDDEEVTAALVSLDRNSGETGNEVIKESDEKNSLPLVTNDGVSEQLQVVLGDEGAKCSGGVVRIPLEFTLAGSTRRLVVSIAIDAE